LGGSLPTSAAGPIPAAKGGVRKVCQKSLPRSSLVGQRIYGVKKFLWSNGHWQPSICVSKSGVSVLRMEFENSGSRAVLADQPQDPRLCFGGHAMPDNCDIKIMLETSLFKFLLTQGRNHLMANSLQHKPLGHHHRWINAST
jgi:hypothetical protein